MSIVDNFDALMSHLNSEENSMAGEFKAELQELFPNVPTSPVAKYNITKLVWDQTPHFAKLVKYLFDDCETVEEEYSKHSACNVTLQATIDLETAEGAVEYAGVDIPAEDLVGDWLVYACNVTLQATIDLDTSREYSWGIDWDNVYEIFRGARVETTKTETKWNSIHVESSAPCSKE